MKTTVNFSMFCDSFSDSYKDNFSYYGKKALFDYLEQLEEETGDEMELDTVALCCDYNEYAAIEDLALEYRALRALDGYNSDDEDEREEWRESALDWLRDRTTVIEWDEKNEFMEERTSGIIIQVF